MSKLFSRSEALGSRVMFAAMQALQQADGKLRSRDVAARVAQQLEFDDWAQEIIESNGLPRWRMYLHFFSVDSVKAGFLLKEKGVWQITEPGAAALRGGAEAYFRAAQTGYRAWRKEQVPTSAESTVDFVETEPTLPPEERFKLISNETNAALSAELLERLKSCDPGFFEGVVIKLLLKMGYGGSHAEAGQAVGRSGDGGIDGVIAEDRLGLDSIYVQAKRWQGSVGEPPLRDFLGALVSRGANKGVFITTGLFTDNAQQFARRSPQHKVVLIDGPRLAELMIEHDLGVSVAATYQLKRIDSDFFAED